MQQRRQKKRNGPTKGELRKQVIAGAWKKVESPGERYSMYPPTKEERFGKPVIESPHPHLLPVKIGLSLEQLRTMPYEKYLQTEHWASVRSACVARWSNRCALCYTKGALHVHHRTYCRRGQEKPEDVIALCADCHVLFHDKLPEWDSEPLKKLEGW